MTKPLEVVAAVIRRHGRILLTRRPLHKDRGGLWEFPGGKIGEGEAPQAALVREIQEELACTIAVGALLTTVEHAYPDVTVRLHAYEATLRCGEPRALEPPAICWIRPDEVRRFELSEADRTIAGALEGIV